MVRPLFTALRMPLRCPPNTKSANTELACLKSIQPRGPRGALQLPIVMGALIAVVVAVVAAFTLLTQPAPAPAPALFRVHVYAEGKPVAGASVQVYDDEALVGEAATNKQGTAALADLPAKVLTLKVSKPGYRPLVQAVDASHASTRLELQALGKPLIIKSTITLKVKDKATGAPLAGVAVTLVVAGEKKALATGLDGSVAVSASFLAQVAVKLTKPGYRQQAFTLLAKKANVERVVELESEPRSPLDFETIKIIDKETRVVPLEGTVLVTVTDKQNASLQGAQVKVFEKATQAYVASQETDENGLAILENLSLGKKVFFTAFKEGYLPFDGSPLAKEVVETTSIEIQLEAATPKNSQAVRFIATDEEGSPLPAKVWIVTPPASVLAEVEVNKSGVQEVELSKEATYYAYATSPGMLPTRSKKFTAGEAVELPFKEMTAENAANLTLAAKDEDSRAVYRAVASLLTSEGLFAGPARVTDAEGLASFESLPLGEYKAHVTYGQAAAQVKFTLAETTAINVTIELAVAVLRASAVDAVTEQPIPANFTSYRYDAPFHTCTAPATAACSLKIKAGVPTQARASSTGYLDFAISKTLDAGVEDEFKVVLIPSSAATQPMVQLLNLTTIGGKPVAFVKPGGTYEAHFLLVSPQESETYGLHVRVGDKDNASQEIAGILDAPAEGALSVATSHFFKPSQQCWDLDYDQQVDGVWKWVDIAYEGAGSRILKLKIKVSESARSSDKLQLRFRAYSRKGPVWSRSPADEDLGFNESSATKAGCYATAFAQDYEVVVPAPVSLAPEEVARREFTPSLTIDWDPDTQKLIPPVKEIVLQVDSIMPADVVPLSIMCPGVAEVGPRVLVSAVESNATPPTTACYGYDEAAGMLWFKSGDAGNPACPIRMRGNEIKGDSAVLPIACGIAPRQVLRLPIRVATKSLESFFIQPESEALGEGNAAKLIYLVNNKQLGPRTFLLESFAGAYAAQAAAEKTEVSLDGPGVKAIVWRGPGILDVSEPAVSPAAGEPALVLKEYSYNPDVEFKVRGVSYGTLGLPTGSCADHKCCSQAWCAKKAAQQALEFLKAEAPKIAEATAFRRGGGMPWRYFSPSKPFAFYTAMQVKEGGAAALESLGVNTSLLAACGREKPGVFEVKAESQNDSSWSYVAKTMELTKHGYVEKEGRDAAPERMALCNFLYGAASNINSSSTSNEFTWHQKSKFDLKINVCMYPIFQGWSPLCALGLPTLPIHPRFSILSYNYEAIENEGPAEDGINKIAEKITSSNYAVLGIGDEGGKAMKECMSLSPEWKNTLVSWATRSLDWLRTKERKPYSQVMADWVNQIVPIAVGTCIPGGAEAAGRGNIKNCRGLLHSTLVGGVQGLPGGYTIKVCDDIQIRIDVGITGTDCLLNLAPEVTEAERGTQLIKWLASEQVPTLSCTAPFELPIAGTGAVK